MASTNKRLTVPVGTKSFIADIAFEASNVTTGVGKTGLAYNTSSMVAYSSKNHAAPAVMTLVNGTVGTFVSLGFVEVDSTNQPGLYQLGVPDALLDTAGVVEIIIKGASNVSDCRLTIEVVGYVQIASGLLKPY